MNPAFLAASALLLSPAAAQTTTRVSLTTAGAQADSDSLDPFISADGRYVAFTSYASNLASGDTNGFTDVFVHDRQTGQTSRVSLTSAGGQGNGDSYDASISADGRYVAFASWATNLVAGDANGWADVFVHDRQTGQTSLVSVDSAGAHGNHYSYAPFLAADGLSIAFTSRSDNLVAGDAGGWDDVFVRDFTTGQTHLVSVDSTGAQAVGDSYAPSLSADGTIAAFESDASNLVAGDGNGAGDVFVRELPTGQTSRVSVNSAGAESNSYSYMPQVSADGRFVAFISFATNLAAGDTNGAQDVFIHDRQTGQTGLVSVNSAGTQGNGDSLHPRISADGRFVAFNSGATNLVPGDANFADDVFVHDRATGQTSRVSLDSAGAEGNNASFALSLSADGRYVAFHSSATNLVTGDTNLLWDVFVHDRGVELPSLTRSGLCPGLITLTVGHATAGGRVVLVFGNPGSFVKPTPPCQGLMLGIGAPTLGARLTADGTGTAILNINLPGGACGRSLQAVDVASCLPTNVVVL